MNINWILEIMNTSIVKSKRNFSFTDISEEEESILVIVCSLTTVVSILGTFLAVWAICKSNRAKIPAVEIVVANLLIADCLFVIAW